MKRALSIAGPGKRWGSAVPHAPAEARVDVTGARGRPLAPRRPVRALAEKGSRSGSAPPPRVGVVPRPRLEAILDHLGESVLALAAPAGAGKTTLLAQWAARDERAVRRLSLAGVGDVAEAAHRIVEALVRVAPFDRRLADELAGAAVTIDGQRLGRITAAVGDARPFLLVIDDVHHAPDGEAADLLAKIAAVVPVGSRVVLSGRRRLGARFASLRCAGVLADLGADELAMTHSEIAATLESVGVRADASVVEEIYSRSEGWAVGVHTLAVSLRHVGRTGRAPGRLMGAVTLGDHFSQDVLGGLPARARDLLVRTSILKQICASLAVFMTGDDRAGTDLHELRDRGVPMTAVDTEGEWLRPNPLLREHLLGELRHSAPTVEPGLHLLASRWHSEHGMPDPAFWHALAAGDRKTAGRIFEVNLLEDESRGRAEVLRERRAALGSEDARADLAVAVAMAWHDGLTRGGEARRLLAIAEASGAEDAVAPLGFSSLPSAVAAWRAMFGKGGADELRASARALCEAESEAAPMRGLACELLGASLLVDGRLDDAAVELRRALHLLPADLAAHEQQVLGLLAAGALLAGNSEGALLHATHAVAVIADHGLDGLGSTALTVATLAALLTQQGDAPGAAAQLSRASRLLSDAERLPWLGVLATLMCARANRELGHLRHARDLMASCERLVAAWPPGAGLARYIADERGRLAAAEGDGGPAVDVQDGATALSNAELRILRMLPSGDSLAEIANSSHLSRNTVKTHVAHIYRKLGVSSRQEAVERALVLDFLGTSG